MGKEWAARSLWAKDNLVLDSKEAEVERMRGVMELMGLQYGYEIEVSMLQDPTLSVPMWQVVQRERRDRSDPVVVFFGGVIFGALMCAAIAAVMYVASV